ncbi:hypothetical protein L537_3312 [Bordetella hinzii 1277]|nr:hypothetical protein L537_3312 [Bordetella hinzii 1277]
MGMFALSRYSGGCFPDISPNLVRIFLSVFLAVSLTACGDYGPDMRSQLSGKLPAYWNIDRFEIEGWEVVSRQPPRWLYSFDASIVPREDLYRSAGVLDATTVLVPVAREGERRHIKGMAGAKFSGGAWLSEFGFDGREALSAMAPLGTYETRHVVAGTPEFTHLLSSAEAALRELDARIAADEVALASARQAWSLSDRRLKTESADAAAMQRAEQEQMAGAERQMERDIAQGERILDETLRRETDERLAAEQRSWEARLSELRTSERQAVAALRAHQSSIPAGMSQAEKITHYRRLDEQRFQVQSQYSETIDRERRAYQERVAQASRDFLTRRASEREAIRRNAVQAMQDRASGLQEKNAQWSSSRQQVQQQLAMQQQEIERLAAALQQRKQARSDEHEALRRVKSMLSAFN